MGGGGRLNSVENFLQILCTEIKLPLNKYIKNIGTQILYMSRINAMYYKSVGEVENFYKCIL